MRTINNEYASPKIQSLLRGRCSTEVVKEEFVLSLPFCVPGSFYPTCKQHPSVTLQFLPFRVKRKLCLLLNTS
ncbi:hypothetical protein GBAR_LOCUS30774, partial [Geodia barretti]